MKKLFFTLLIAFTTLYAIGQTEKTKTVTIAPYMQLSYGAFFKNLILKSEDTYADFIEGFNFEWGYIYRLKIKEKKLENPPQDIGDTEYSLVKVLSKTKVPDDYTFTLRLEKDLYLGPGEQVSTFKKIDDTTYLYLDKVLIEVPDILKQDFEKTLILSKSYTGVFSFINAQKIKLLRISVYE